MSDEERSSLLLREIFLAGFMSGLPAANVAWAASRLASTMDDVRVQAGGVIYRQGEPSDDHFFVVEGEVALEAEGAPPWVFGERSLIGTVDLMLDRPRSRNAVARRASHLLRMPAQDWLDMLEDNFELTRSAVQGLASGINEVRVALGAVDITVPGVAVPLPSGALGEKVGLIDRIFALRGVGLFSEADVQALIDLAVLAREQTFEAGAPVVVRGEASASLFVVLSGEVSTSRVAGGPRESFGAGHVVFGPSAAAAENPAHEARAVLDTRVLRIAREDYLDVMEEHFALARSSMKAISLEREALVNEQGRRAQAPVTPARP